MNTEFYSSRLDLTEISNLDLQMIHRLDSLPESDEYNTIGIPANLSETEKNMRVYLLDQERNPRQFFCWKAVEQETEKAVGIIGLRCTADRFRIGEIWYKVFPEFWGKGYATEIAETIVFFAFKKLRLHRVEAGTDCENIASIKVLEKLGFTREGRSRKILPIRGEWRDGFTFAILEDDQRVMDLLKSRREY